MAKDTRYKDTRFNPPSVQEVANSTQVASSPNTPGGATPMPRIALPNPFLGAPGLHINPMNPDGVAQVVKGTKNKRTAVAAGTNGTLVSVILDESSSMSSCWDTTISGFNEFLYSQQLEAEEDESDDRTLLNVVKFNGSTVWNLHESILDIEEVPQLDRESYRPSGSTNLLDAIGETIEKLDDHLRSKRKKNRPSILFVIMTDGEENSSRRFNNSAIKEMVNAHEDKDWVFMFLGANIDAFQTGSTFGMRVNNTMQYSTNNMVQTMAAVSSSTTRYKAARAAGASTESIMTAGLFTDAERDSSID